MSLLDILTGGKDQEANSDLNAALASIQGVQTPDIASMEYQIQKLVQAGVLTPEQAQTYLQQSSALQNENVDQTGTAAQQNEISGLDNIAAQGGNDAQEQSDMQTVLNNLNTQEQGQRGAILQSQAARGALTGGETLAAQLQANQGDQASANQNALQSNAAAEQRALAALTTAGSAGSALQGQENTQANTVASATDAINKFNSAQQNQTAQYNTDASNKAQAANLANAQDIGNTNANNANAYSAYQAQLPQEVYNDNLQKAQAEAGINSQQADQATGQGEQNAGIVGALTGLGVTSAFGGNQVGQNVKSAGGGNSSGNSGGGGTAGVSAVGNAFGGGSADSVIMNAAHGGVIHDYLSGGEVEADSPREIAHVPGDSLKNDKVPAELSQGEGVIPRTVMKEPDDQVLAFLHRMRAQAAPKVHPEDTAHVIKALGLLRNSQ